MWASPPYDAGRRDAVPYEMIGGGHTGRTESSAPTKQNKNRAKGDVEDAVPYNSRAGRRGRRPLRFLCGTGRGAKPSSAAKIYSYCTKKLLSFLSQCHLTNPLKKV